MLKDRVIAASDDVLEYDNYRYFRRADVRMEWLKPADKTESDRAYLDMAYSNLSGTGAFTRRRRPVPRNGRAPDARWTDEWNVSAGSC